jgi:hypothetical protein
MHSGWKQNISGVSTTPLYHQKDLVRILMAGLFYL